MTDAKKLLDAGDLSGAINAAIDYVKSKPADIPARIFLFELCCFSGEWERAEKQLEVVGKQNVDSMIGTKIYQQNLKAERDRLNYFSDGQKPETMTASPAYIADMLKANELIRGGDTAAARELLDKIDDDRPAFACKVNGEEYEDFRDYNDLTSSVFEVIFKDGFIWIPFTEIVKIDFFKPKSLRDLYWIQGEIELKNGTSGEMFFPALYSGSWKNDSDETRLGRVTDWREVGDDIYVGEGTKLYAFGGEAKPLFDIESIEFIHPEEEE